MIWMGARSSRVGKDVYVYGGCSWSMSAIGLRVVVQACQNTVLITDGWTWRLNTRARVCSECDTQQVACSTSMNRIMIRWSVLWICHSTACVKPTAPTRPATRSHAPSGSFKHRPMSIYMYVYYVCNGGYRSIDWLNGHLSSACSAAAA